MPIKKWTIQALFALMITFLIFSLNQYRKGVDLETSIEFGLLWSCITVTVFTVSRIYYYRKHIYCVICNDLPQNEHIKSNLSESMK